MADNNLVDISNNNQLYITEDCVLLAYRRQFEDLDWDTKEDGVVGGCGGVDNAVPMGVVGSHGNWRGGV